VFQGKSIFAQLMALIPRYEFRKCVQRYKGDYKLKNYTCWEHFLCLSFAQLTYRESLRDIEASLRVHQHRLYHMGFRSWISRNTIANANMTRDWRIYADFAQHLISEARRLYANDPFAADLEQTAYALDSTTIDLCLSLFPWAHFRKTKGAVKMHTLLDIRAAVPSFIHITDGKTHDVKILDLLPLEAGAFYVMDRGYLDFKRLAKFSRSMAFFVIRAKRNMRFRRLTSSPVDKSTGLRCDQIIRLTGLNTGSHYADKLRRVCYYDKEHKRRLCFLTNNLTLPALTIALLYKCRWQVELFFKWIKQHLRIKAFYGTTENAVKLQIWVAISTYVLVAIAKKKLGLSMSLYTILQVLSLSVFENMPIIQAFRNAEFKDVLPENPKQPTLF
jgi:hypothetical protein